MRAISLWQPWAQLLVVGVKLHETRGRALPTAAINVPTAIHASKRPIRRAELGVLHDVCVSHFGSKYITTLPRQAILGRVTFVSSTPTEEHPAAGTIDLMCGNYAPGRHAWRAENPIPAPVAIPYVGRQYWFSIPDELLLRAREVA